MTSGAGMPWILRRAPVGDLLVFYGSTDVVCEFRDIGRALHLVVDARRRRAYFEPLVQAVYSDLLIGSLVDIQVLTSTSNLICLPYDRDAKTCLLSDSRRTPVVVR